MTIVDSEIDYGDFKIFINVDGLDSKEARDSATKISMNIGRREKMYDNDIISKKVFNADLKSATTELVNVYAKYFISGWEGKLRDKPLGDYTVEAATELLAATDNAYLFSDIVACIGAIKEKKEKLDEEEIKN